MSESAYCTNERANTSIGRMTLSHPVKLRRHRGNHIVTHTSPVYTTAKANRRQLIVDRSSFDGGLGILDHSSQQHAVRGLSKPDRADAASHSTFKATLNERRINVDRVSISGGIAVWLESERGPCLIAKSIPAEVKSIGQPRNRPTSNADSYSRYCLRVTTSRLGNNRTTSSSEVEHRGRELEQWDKPLCASVPALHSSIGSDKRDERD